MYEYEFELWKDGQLKEIVKIWADTTAQAVSKLSDQYKGAFRFMSCTGTYIVEAY